MLSTAGCCARRLEEDRRVMLLQHLSFIQHPSADLCPYRDGCVHVAIQTLLETKAHR